MLSDTNRSIAGASILNVNRHHTQQARFSRFPQSCVFSAGLSLLLSGLHPGLPVDTTTTMYTLAFLLLLPLLSLVPEARGSPLKSELACGKAVGKAVYFLTNDDVNGVAAIPIGSDGTLSGGTVTETGGAGSVAVDGENEPATPDALVGQSSLTIAGNVRKTHPPCIRSKHPAADTFG